MIRRGELWWARLPVPRRSEPGYSRPILVVQSDDFNRSGIGTVVAAAISTNTALAEAPGNVLLPRGTSKLRQDSVVNVSQLITLDKSYLRERIGRLSSDSLERVEDGIRLVLALDAPRASARWR